jgi:hypothetical protein
MEVRTVLATPLGRFWFELAPSMGKAQTSHSAAVHSVSPHALGIMEMRTVLATLLGRFWFELAPSMGKAETMRRNRCALLSKKGSASPSRRACAAAMLNQLRLTSHPAAVSLCFTAGSGHHGSASNSLSAMLNLLRPTSQLDAALCLPASTGHHGSAEPAESCLTSRTLHAA